MPPSKREREEKRERASRWRSYRDHFAQSPSLSDARTRASFSFRERRRNEAFWLVRPFSSGGCSDPRRRSSDSWVVPGPYLLSRSPFVRPVYIFHRLEILFARSAAKLSRFEIFMNGSGTSAGPAARTKRDASALVLRHRAICDCCQTRCCCLFVRANLPLSLSSYILPPSLRYCLWNSSNGAG